MTPNDKGPWPEGFENTMRDAGRVTFGDRVGLLLFLGSATFFVVTWRIDFFISDTLTIANTLVNVADGHLDIRQLVYGQSFEVTPGMSVVDGRLFGRNYGHVFFALPFLWLLEGVAAVADPSVAIVGIWSLLLLAFFDQLGGVVGSRTRFALVGVAIAVLTFGVNVSLVRPIDSVWFPLMALQFSTIVAGSLVPVVAYRLLSRMHDHPSGIAAGATVALATPVAVWATIPKRHTFTALLALLTVYSFYRSRSASSEHTAFRFRSLSYVWVGLTAWIHAPEGAVLLACLAIADLTTARSNHPKQLFVIASVLAVSLLPLLVTNTLISGNPLAVPRMIPGYSGDETIHALERSLNASGGDAGGISAGSADPNGGDAADPKNTASPIPELDILDSVFGILAAFTGQFASGLDSLSRPHELWQTFVRRGDPEYRRGRRAINLSVLESMPLAVLLVHAPVAKVSKLHLPFEPRNLSNKFTQPMTAHSATDLLVVLYLAIVVIIYAPNLPINASITVRYLHPVYPLIVYFVIRNPSIRDLVNSCPKLLAWSYAGFVLLGGQLLVVALFLVTTTPEEAIQFHGLLSLSSAGLLVGWIALSNLRGGHERTGAVLVALAGSVTTLYALMAVYIYFGFMDRFAIPISRLVANALTFL